MSNQNPPPGIPKHPFQYYCDRIADLAASRPDVYHMLHRIEALLEAGELSESILLRLQPPARKPRKTNGVSSGWFQ